MAGVHHLSMYIWHLVGSFSEAPVPLCHRSELMLPQILCGKFEAVHPLADIFVRKLWYSLSNAVFMWRSFDFTRRREFMGVLHDL